MDFKVGVFSKGQISGEVVNEAKKVLQELALKYKCRFELSKETEESTSSEGKASKTKKSASEKGSIKKGVYLSFGGELEL